MSDGQSSTIGFHGCRTVETCSGFSIPPCPVPAGEPSVGPHRLTVLHPRNFKKARKTILADGRVVAEEIPAYFRPSEFHFTSIEDISRFIDAGIDGNHAVITGKVVRLTEDSTSEKQTVHRKSANIADVPQRLIAIDIDGAPCPEYLEWHEEPDVVVEHLVRTMLPVCFQGVSYCWFWTSSHGTRDKVFKQGLNASEVRVRILFLADRDMTSREMASWLASVDGIDHSMFQPERLNFVCRPYLRHPGCDPLNGLKIHGFVRHELGEVPVPAQVNEPLLAAVVDRPSNGGYRGSSLSRLVSNLALANLSRWVPLLELHGLRIQSGSFWCVAHWRPSSSGRPLHHRVGQVSISSRGIRDFGASGRPDAGMTPVRFVALARDCSHPEAISWLCSAFRAELAEMFPPWKPKRDAQVADA